jgi:hypothetical protein
VSRARGGQRSPKVEANFDNLFGSDDDEKEIINLEDTEEVPEWKPKPDNSVKLSAFQCVICMDDVTDLTVTYCGTLASCHLAVISIIC